MAKHDEYDPTANQPTGPGGLAACHVCNGAEGTLPTDCPGRALTELEQEHIYAGGLDYRDFHIGDTHVESHWVIPDRDPYTREPRSVAFPTNFEDVGEFHAKFNVRSFRRGAGPPRALTPEELEFRVKFMFEELFEYLEAVGGVGSAEYKTPSMVGRQLVVTNGASLGAPVDLPKAFDALLDLAYVTFGTAHMHLFPWQVGWDEVQRANITKERCGIDHLFVECNLGTPLYCDFCNGTERTGGDRCHHGRGVDATKVDGCGRPAIAHSKRGSALDVIKPAGWTAPDVTAVLRKAGWDREGR